MPALFSTQSLLTYGVEMIITFFYVHLKMFFEHNVILSAFHASI